jgi:putative spermidine/putrescine transport system ATP-binding protein
MANLRAVRLRKTFRSSGPDPHKSERETRIEIDHEFSEGAINVLVGPSGSGKTTILNIIAGLIDPDDGQVVLDGVDITREAVERRNFGYIFQDYALFPHLNVSQNIDFGMRARRLPREERSRRRDEMLGFFRISHLANREVHALSGGEKQRVALARALATQPRVLLMDEPLSALDASLRIQLRSELKAFLQQLAVTTLYVTHDQEEAMTLAHTLLILRDGALQQIGTPLELYENPINPFVAGFLGEANFFSGTRSPSGTIELPFAETRLPALADAITVMVRPEDVLPCSGPDALFDAEVEEIVFLGDRARLHLRAGPTRVQMNVGTAESARYPVGDKISVCFRAAGIRTWPNDQITLLSAARAG